MLSYLWLNFTFVTILCYLELRHVVIGCGHLHHAMWVPTILLWGASQTTITGNAKKDHGRWIWLPRQGMVKDFRRSKGCDSQVATGNIYGYWPNVRSAWLNIGQVLVVFHVYGLRRSPSPQTCKKRTDQIQAILIEQAWSVKIYYLERKHNFLAGHSGWSRAGKIVPYCQLR